MSSEAPDWTDRDLRKFDPRGFDFGRPKPVLAAWFAVQHLIVQKWWCPSTLRIALLRAFGAEIGESARVREGVYIHLPWRLSIGEYSQIGREVMIINHAPVSIGSHVTVSQQAFLTSGGHDHRSEGLDYKHARIDIGDGAWICARGALGPGVAVQPNETVGLGETMVRTNPGPGGR